MRVMVTGATGFVGRHVVSQLLLNGHSVIAIARNASHAREMPWFESVEFIQCDLHKDNQFLFQDENIPDVLVHLAWSGLPNYQGFFHISENLTIDIAFLVAAIDAGVSHLMVAGTCLEYGMQYGPLDEELGTLPTTPYGFAKDVLRKALQFKQLEKSYTLQWVRLFYMYGEGQNENSLLAQLDSAIDSDQSVFNMSTGDQLRDYLPIHEVAKNFALLLDNPKCTGVINCSSGVPISVYDLVKQRCSEKLSDIRLNRGFYSYPNYEPMAFWGVPTKLAALKP